MGQDSVKRLMDVANGLLEGLKMQKSWRESKLVSLYNGKDDTRSCGNYRIVELLKHGMMVIEKNV